MSQPTIRIVMLGHTAVGKTTYMASLYGELQRSFSGFTLSAVSSSDHEHLVQTARDIRRNIYPPPTAQRSQYTFGLRFYGTDVLSFHWADYRGGAVNELSGSEQAHHLRADLEQADGLIMLCDADALSRGDLRVSNLGRMTVMVTHALHNLQRPISLAVVFTKCDLVVAFSEQMLSHFTGLISAVSASEHVLGALIPVGCGRQMLNTPMPLFFALSASVNSQANMLALELQHQQAIVAQLQGGNSGIAWFFDQFRGLLTSEKTKDQLLFETGQLASEKLQEYARIKSSLDAITSWVHRLPRITRESTGTAYIARLNQAKIVDTDNNGGAINPFDAFL